MDDVAKWWHHAIVALGAIATVNTNLLIGFAIGAVAGYMLRHIGYFLYEADRGNRPMKVKTKTTPMQEIEEGCRWKLRALMWAVFLVLMLAGVLVWVAASG